MCENDIIKNRITQGSCRKLDWKSWNPFKGAPHPSENIQASWLAAAQWVHWPETKEDEFKFDRNNINSRNETNNSSRMTTSSLKTMHQFFSAVFLFLLLPLCSNAQTARQANNTGFTCNFTRTCTSYAFYRATAPNFTDLASIGDLFSVSRLMISTPSNISSSSLNTPLLPNTQHTSSQ